MGRVERSFSWNTIMIVFVFYTKITSCQPRDKLIERSFSWKYDYDCYCLLIQNNIMSSLMNDFCCLLLPLVSKCLIKMDLRYERHS